jgi:hypothetical protein
MNLDELMEVWRAQAASPLADKTLLHLALRQEQAKLQRERRTGRRVMYLMTALMLAFMAALLAVMTSSQGDGVRSVWDYVVAAVGAAAGLVMASTIYLGQRAQAAREQGFGDTLRDQLRRRIAQLEDDATTTVRRAMVIVLSSAVCATAITVASRRINELPYSADWLLKGAVFVGLSFLLVRWLDRKGRRDLLARKRRLEALLEELDRE